MSNDCKEEEMETWKSDALMDFKKFYFDNHDCFPSDDECEEFWTEYLESDYRKGEEEMNAQEAIKAMFEGKLISLNRRHYQTWGISKLPDGNFSFVTYYENTAPTISGNLHLDLNENYKIVEEK